MRYTHVHAENYINIINSLAPTCGIHLAYLKAPQHNDKPPHSQCDGLSFKNTNTDLLCSANNLALSPSSSQLPRALLC